MKLKFLLPVAFAGTFILISCDQISNNTAATASIINTNTENRGVSHNDIATSSDLMEIMKKTSTKMKEMKMTGDPDYDFASMMVIHHEGGIEMANEEISKGKNTEMVNLAKKIKAEQQKEQKELKAFTENHKPGGQNKAFMDEMHKHMEKSEQDMKKMTMSGNIDKDFASMMAMHHKHGIEMAQTEVKHGKDQKIKGMAEKSIQEQQKEIKELETHKNH